MITWFRLALLSTLLGALLAPTSARAQFFDMPELIGPAPEYGGLPIVVEFDLGRKFSEVRSVILVLEATTTPLSYESCGSILVPEPCTRVNTSIGFLVQIDGEGSFAWTTIDGFRSHPKSRAGVFEPFGLSSLEHLEDGRGTLKLWWDEPLFAFGGRSAGSLIPPTGEILDAYLVVDGTPLRRCARGPCKLVRAKRR